MRIWCRWLWTLWRREIEARENDHRKAEDEASHVNRIVPCHCGDCHLEGDDVHHQLDNDERDGHVENHSEAVQRHLVYIVLLGAIVATL